MARIAATEDSKGRSKGRRPAERPTRPPRAKILPFRVSETEDALIERAARDYAETNGYAKLGKSQYVREVVLRAAREDVRDGRYSPADDAVPDAQQVRAVDPELVRELRALRVELTREGTSLNQIRRRFNQLRANPPWPLSSLDIDDMEELSDQLDELPARLDRLEVALGAVLPGVKR